MANDHLVYFLHGWLHGEKGLYRITKVGRTGELLPRMSSIKRYEEGRGQLHSIDRKPTRMIVGLQKHEAISLEAHFHYLLEELGYLVSGEWFDLEDETEVMILECMRVAGLIQEYTTDTMDKPPRLLTKKAKA